MSDWQKMRYARAAGASPPVGWRTEPNSSRNGEEAGLKAVIMAGGEGTRLRPLTSRQPKPMLPLANRPMMEHILTLLRSHGIDEVVVTLAFMANTVRNY